MKEVSAITAKTLLLSVCLVTVYGNEFQKYQQLKFHSGRRICATTKEVNQPIKVTEPYTKPVYKRFTRKCDDQMCNGVKLVYETAYRDVYKTNIVNVPVNVCCPGWRTDRKTSFGCNERKCSHPCMNGGTCLPQLDKCSCPPGFTGKRCETDLDECLLEKPCDHYCLNTPGSYQCSCKHSFVLQDDGQSCRKNDEDNNTPFEAEDLDGEHLEKRIQRMEKILGLKDTIETFGEDVNIAAMNSKLNDVAQDVIHLQQKLKELEYKLPKTLKAKGKQIQRYKTRQA